MSDGDRFYVKLFRTSDLEWAGLSVFTRGLFAELLLLVNPQGRLRLGRAGLRALEVPLRAPWAELEPHVAALLDLGRIAVDGDHLVVPDFERDQAVPKTSTERSREKRQRDATAGDAMQRDATAGDAMQRDATAGDACNDKERKTDQKDQISKTEQSSVPRGRAPARARLDDPNAEAILVALSAAASLERIATRATAEALVAFVNGGGKTLAAVVTGIGEFAAQEAIVASSSRGPSDVRDLASGLRGFVSRAREAPKEEPIPRRGHPGAAGPRESSSGFGNTFSDDELLVPPKRPTTPDDLTSAKMFTAFDEGYRRATGDSLTPHRRTADDAALLGQQWTRYAEIVDGGTVPEFLELLSERVADWVKATNNDTDRRFQAGFSVAMFVKWLVEERAAGAANDRPGAGPPAPAWGAPSDEEIAAAFAPRTKAGDR